MKRKPILLDKNTIAFLQIFHKTDDIEMLYLYDIIDNYMAEHNINSFEESAKEFIEQFDEHYCAIFLQELVIACLNKLQKNDKKFKTDHYVEILNRLNWKLENNL